jgi:hypothetical protein
MLEELKKSLCIGLDDTQVKLIMPKEIPDEESGGDETWRKWYALPTFFRTFKLRRHSLRN